MNGRFILRLMLLSMFAAVDLTIAEEKAESGPWIQSPARSGPATGKDKEAREELFKLLDARQDEEFRKAFTIVIPDEPTGLPSEFDLFVYGSYLDRSLLRMEIQVRKNKATMEMVTIQGIQRGEVSLALIEQLARQLSYAFRAEEIAKTPDDLRPSSGMWMMATHVPYRRLELVSRTAKTPFQLRTDAWQLLARPVSVNTGGVRGFVATQVERKLRAIAEERTVKVEPNEETRREIVGRLQNVAVPQTGDQLYVFQENLAAVEAMLYSRLAVDWKIQEAQAELRRLRLFTHDVKLAIVTSPDPTNLLEQSICGRDGGMYLWSLDFMTNPLTPKHVDLLIRSLPHLPDEYRAREILAALQDAETSPEQIAFVDRFRRDTKVERSRIAATIFLLRQTNRDELFKELLSVSSKLKMNENYDNPNLSACQGLLNYSVQRGKWRTETAQLVRALLDRIPTDANSRSSNISWLAKHLGSLGNRGDLPRLESYCREGDSYQTSNVIEAISRIDPELALVLARKEVEKYNQGDEPGRFGNHVELELFFWRRDQSIVKLLEIALMKYRHGSPDETSWIVPTEQVLKYLKSGDVQERQRIALQYLEDRYFDDSWRADVAKQLISEGADPQAVQPLLKPRPKPRVRW